ncbi:MULTISPECIES: DedA family protein [Myroides]|uniref:DedA family protein n=1 Tax=Myroides TaxID=76831 RepID=UPI001323D19B|nr:MULTISPECIES: VTT domain-containing protein [Myroides]MVX36456.1 DedA family protein [Myroides sp. LoEW2-1]UVD78192.1 VTT domain-containing protein [Myroides albus]
MEEFQISQLINPEFYINLQIAGHSIGIYVVLFIVFAETGLFAGFFLPGDSLLFLSGIYSTALMQELFNIDSDFINVALLATFVAISGILGNTFGYWFGAKSGNYLYNVKDNFIYKKKYLYESKVFFERHGGRAIIFARFLPVVRTFAPIIAGIVRMDVKRFMFYNVISSFLWATTLIFAGHYLQVWLLESYDINLKHYIEYIVLFLVLVTTLPVIIKLLKSKAGKSNKKEISSEEGE